MCGLRYDSKPSEPSSRVARGSPSPLVGGGAMGEFIRAKDWSATALGPIDAWPTALRTTVSLALGSTFPINIIWGASHAQIYNDGYWPLCGEKHPNSMGQDFRECWASALVTIGTAYDRAWSGQASYLENQRMFLDRNGYLEETFFTFSFSPLRDDSGEVVGLFHPVTETTARMLSERRVRTLRDLAGLASSGKTIREACVLAAETLSANDLDLPFVLVYLLSENGQSELQLACTAGLPAGGPGAATRVPVASDPSAGWPLAAALASERAVEVTDLPGRVGRLVCGSYPESPPSAVLLPIRVAGVPEALGVVVAGVSPRRRLDAGYRDFYDLLGSAISVAIGNARAREEEKKRVEKLAELDRAKTIFFSNVSHEFRTPLALMLAPIDAMRAEASETGEARERVELLHRNAQRLLKLVNTLLEFSRIEAGRVDASYEPVDLAALTVELASSFRSAFMSAGLELVVDCAPPSEPVYVDRDMWEKIVLNLLSNAFKFTFEGSVSVRMREVQRAVELRVADTGTGIAEANHQAVFERFHRIEGARSRSHEGSGIGLSLVQELVRLHGGTIRVESRVAQGTTFIVTVPLGSAHLPHERVRAPGALPSTSDGPRAYVQEAHSWLPALTDVGPAPVLVGRQPRERLVVVDDNADMRAYLTRLLRERWDVEASGDGLSALEMIRRDPPALVVADVMMPGLDGLGLVRALRGAEGTRDVPVLLLSARAGEEATAEGLGAGADDYLVKPFTARDLFVRITAKLTAARGARAIREERATLLHAFMQAPFPLAILRGPRHVVEVVNEAHLKMWGKDETIVGAPLPDVLPEAHRPMLALLDEVYRTGTTHHAHEELARIAAGPAGEFEDVYFKSVHAPLLDAHGKVEGIMTCSFDVTAGVLGLQALEQASRAKDEFLATMSHELRTPLNAMLGWATMLRKDHHDPAKLALGLSVIERNAQTQTRIVSDLLDTSRIIGGKLRLVLKKMDVGAGVRAAAEVVRPAADSKAVRLVLDLGGDLETVGDLDRMQQIAWNLLSNAVRFTPAGGTVTVTVERLASAIRMSVTDTGVGIALEHQAHIFERFRQVDSSTTRAHGGLGLGLAIVRHLVEAQGGTVAAISEGIGRGATFVVTLPVNLPLADASNEEEPKPAPAPAGPRPEGEKKLPLRHIRVLLVEDDDDSLMLIRMVLEEAGARVVGVASARAAMSARGPFDVIVSDIGMPEVDGYTLMRSLRSQPGTAGTPAIALTAYARLEDAERAIAAGYQQHLAKPVESSQLIKTVQQVLHDAP